MNLLALTNYIFRLPIVSVKDEQECCSITSYWLRMKFHPVKENTQLQEHLEVLNSD